MKKKTAAIVGAGALVLASVVPAATASAGINNDKGKLCKNGTFRVVHKGDKINDVKIKKGYYKIYVGNGANGQSAPSCYQASSYFHEWLATGETTGNYLVADGTRGKKSTIFSNGQGGQFFQIKKVKKSKS